MVPLIISTAFKSPLTAFATVLIAIISFMVAVSPLLLVDFFASSSSKISLNLFLSLLTSSLFIPPFRDIIFLFLWVSFVEGRF
jgi:hypothetical protein